MEVYKGCFRNTSIPSFLKVLSIRANSISLPVHGFHYTLECYSCFFNQHWLPINIFWAVGISVLPLSCDTRGWLNYNFLKKKIQAQLCHLFILPFHQSGHPLELSNHWDNSVRFSSAISLDPRGSDRSLVWQKAEYSKVSHSLYPSISLQLPSQHFIMA